MRASRGEAAGWAVLIVVCIALAPFAIWAYPGDGTRCCRAGCGCGEDMTCWLRPEGVRDGIWRRPRLPGDGINDGDGTEGAGCGVGVPAGESDGERSELMSMTMDACRQTLSCSCAKMRSGLRGPLGLLHVRWTAADGLGLRSRITGTVRHRVPCSGRHGTKAGGLREAAGSDAQGDGITSVMGGTGCRRRTWWRRPTVSCAEKRWLGAPGKLGPATNQVMMQQQQLAIRGQREASGAGVERRGGGCICS